MVNIWEIGLCILKLVEIWKYCRNWGEGGGVETRKISVRISTTRSPNELYGCIPEVAEEHIIKHLPEVLDCSESSGCIHPHQLQADAEHSEHTARWSCHCINTVLHEVPNVDCIRDSNICSPNPEWKPFSLLGTPINSAWHWLLTVISYVSNCQMCF